LIAFASSLEVYICTEKMDMRRSFDGLARGVEEVIKKDPFSGHLFVFFNKKRDRTKILFWDKCGYAIYYKRLEEGTFHIPDTTEKVTGGIKVPLSTLNLILDGVNILRVRKEKRFQLNRNSF
jgi:transposase